MPPPVDASPPAPEHMDSSRSSNDLVRSVSPSPIRSRHSHFSLTRLFALQASKSSLTLGELACVVLLPLLAVVDAVLLGASRCFQMSPPRLLSVVDARAGRIRAGGRLTFRELAKLADESHCCKYTAACPVFVFFSACCRGLRCFSGCAFWESR